VLSAAYVPRGIKGKEEENRSTALPIFPCLKVGTHYPRSRACSFTDVQNVRREHGRLKMTTVFTARAHGRHVKSVKALYDNTFSNTAREHGYGVYRALPMNYGSKSRKQQQALHNRNSNYFHRADDCDQADAIKSLVSIRRP